MTVPASTVPLAVAALLDGVNQQVAAAGDTQVVVTVGETSEDVPNNYIAIANDIRRLVDPLAFVGDGGRGWLQETYSIDVVISCAMETVDVQTDPLTLLNRVWQLVSYLETAIRTDPTLGGVVLVARPSETSGSSPVWAANAIGRICEVTIPIVCTASL